LFYKDSIYASKAYRVNPVDTTGAGDAFWGAFLYKIVMNNGPEALGASIVHEIMQFSNAAGALSTTRFGAIPSLPTFQEISACVEKGVHCE
jgi:fructokinase